MREPTLNDLQIRIRELEETVQRLIDHINSHTHKYDLPNEDQFNPYRNKGETDGPEKWFETGK